MKKASKKKRPNAKKRLQDAILTVLDHELRDLDVVRQPNKKFDLAVASTLAHFANSNMNFRVIPISLGKIFIV